MRRSVLAMINHYAKFEMSVCAPFLQLDRAIVSNFCPRLK